MKKWTEEDTDQINGQLDASIEFVNRDLRPCNAAPSRPIRGA